MDQENLQQELQLVLVLVFQQRLRRVVNNIKEALADLDKEKVLEIAKKKAKQIQDMTKELVDYVVEKGTPVVEKAADAVREKAIVVTKGVLNKLEKEEKQVVK